MVKILTTEASMGNGKLKFPKAQKIIIHVDQYMFSVKLKR